MTHRIHASQLFGPILPCVLVAVFLQACDPLAIFQPPRRIGPRIGRTPPAPASLPKPTETERAVVTDGKVREKVLAEGSASRSGSLGSRRSGVSVGDLPGSGATSPAGEASPKLKEGRIQETDLKVEPVKTPGPEEGGDLWEAMRRGPTPPEDPSLIAKITPATSPQSALSLRLAEEGRKLLENQEYEKGLAKLEKAIAIDSRNRFGYYYLAQAHYHLTDYRQSLNFLEIVEPILVEEPTWLARVFALKGKNYGALGFLGRADESYVRALRLDRYNQEALEGLVRMRSK